MSAYWVRRPDGSTSPRDTWRGCVRAAQEGAALAGRPGEWTVEGEDGTAYAVRHRYSTCPECDGAGPHSDNGARSPHEEAWACRECGAHWECLAPDHA